MAVIQDLPPELLERILNFVHGPVDPFWGDEWKRRISLVCRAFVEPGQLVLNDTVYLSDDNKLEHYIECALLRQRRTSIPLKVDYMILYGQEAPLIERLFNEDDIHVRKLSTSDSDEFPPNVLHKSRKMMSGCQKSHFAAESCDADQPGSAGTEAFILYSQLSWELNRFMQHSMLTELTLDSIICVQPTDAFQQLISASLNTLTSLNLFFNDEPFSEYIYNSLCIVAPRIKTLYLSLPQGDDFPSIMLSHLPLFTGLRTLQLCGFSMPVTRTILETLSAELVVLDLTGWPSCEIHFPKRTLLEWLDELPSLKSKQLKRIRVDENVVFDQLMLYEWPMNSVRKGVELRDERRYFTGESSSSVVVCTW